MTDAKIDTAPATTAARARGRGVDSDKRSAAQLRARVRRRRWLFGGGTAVLLVILWQVVVSVGWVKPITLSSPLEIVQTIWTLILNGQLPANLLISGREWLIGFALGFVVGVLLGFILGWYTMARESFEPVVIFLNAVPYVTLLPIFIIWFGIGSNATVACVFYGSFFPIVINTMAGVRSVDPAFLTASRSFGASDFQFFRTVALPSSVPFITSGVRLSVMTALIAVIVGEMYGSNAGIGYMISIAGQSFNTKVVMAGIVVTAIIGVLLTGLTKAIEARFQKWRVR